MKFKVNWASVARAICLAFGVLTTQWAIAQTWPNRPLRIIVGYAPGGSTDVLTRIVGQKLQEMYGVQVVVENKAGAAGNIAAIALAKAPLDDHAFMMTPSPGLLTVNQFLYKPLAFDPDKDFVPVGLVAQTPDALIMKSSTPLHSIKEMIAFAKANPGKLAYSTGGVGTAGHLLIELLRTQQGLKFLHVPYKGNIAALQAILAGEVDFNMDNHNLLVQAVRDGKVRALAVSSEKRWSKLPEVPTFAELGYPDMTVQIWFGFVAQAKMPKSVVARMNQDLNKVLAQPDIISRLRELNMEVMPGTPADMTASINQERERWKKVIDLAEIRYE